MNLSHAARDENEGLLGSFGRLLLWQARWNGRINVVEIRLVLIEESDEAWRLGDAVYLDGRGFNVVISGASELVPSRLRLARRVLVLDFLARPVRLRNSSTASSDEESFSRVHRGMHKDGNGCISAMGWSAALGGGGHVGNLHAS